ncbi:hypothetical protein NDN08_005311 [Rhodosorus marinus]|uniref:Tyrosine-protein kinase ephrin type A/B receptor-like domain-containing protein n=1 Tax=Rhodosorus marinus TaxID=101924 RepID=A0AAV8V562_9RHOD|nr:hypothetical protein NDN08_005311 [Rhodosorus marinus]
MSGFLIFVVLALRLVTGAEGLFGMLPKERDCHWAIYDGTDQQQQCVQRLMDHDALEGAVEFFQDEDFRRVLKIAEFNPLGIPKLSVLDAIRTVLSMTCGNNSRQEVALFQALGFIPKIGPFFKQIANLIDEPLEKLDEKVKKLDEKCEDLDKWAGRLNKGLEYLQAASTFAWAVNIIILPPLVNHLCDDTNAQVTALLETRCSLEELEDLGQPIESLCSVGEVVGDGSSLINSLDGLESFVGEVRDIIDGPVKELQDKEPALNSLKDSIGATSIALTRFIEPFDPVRGLMDSLYEVTKFLDCGDFCIVFDAINIAIDAVLEAFGLKDEVEALFGELLDDLNVPDLDVLNLDVLDFNFGSRLDQIVAGPEVPGTLQRAQFDFLDEISGSFQCTWEAAPGAWLTKIASSLNDETISFSCPAGARPIVYRAEYNVWDCTQELTALMRFPCAENENSCTFDFENLTQCANAEAPDPKLAELVLNPSMLRAQYFCIPFGQTPTILSSYIGLDVTRVAETAFVEVESSPAPVFWVEEKRHDFKHRDIDIMRSPTCAGNRFLKLVDRSDINSCWSAENVAGLPAPFIPSLDLPNRLDAWETERLCYSMWRARREAGQSIYTAVELGTWNFLQQRGATLAILGSAPPAGDICGEYSADASGLRVYCFPELCGVTETESDRAFQPPNDWWSLCEHYGADPIVSSAVLARGAFKSNREAELDRWTEQNRERTESNVCINKFADCESATSATCDLAGCEPDFIGYACLNPVSSAPNGVVTYTFADSEIEVGGGGVRSQICAGDESLSVISAEFGNGFDVLDVTERVQRDQCKSGSCVISARRMAMSLKVDPEENNTLRLDAVCICRAGYELLRVDGDCVLCPTGYTRSNDQDACVAAPRGFYVPSGPLSTPIACSRGTFAEEAASTSCAPCPIGTYSNSLGADSADACLPCPEGTVATRTGEDLCAECPIGTQPNDARTGCDPCPVGTFGVSRGDGYCQDAHPGFFVPEFKFTGQERPCTVGFYNNESGQSKCKAAPLGYYVEEPAWDRLPKKCDEGLTTLRIASTSRFDCISPAECPRPEVGEDCGQFMDRIGVPRSETANGFCQSCLNVEICDYDGGDCCVDTCERTILLDSDLPSLENEFFVRSCDPTKMKCIAPRTGTVACQFSEKFEGLPPGFENTECDNSSPRKGNGICDADLNYPNCQYDGGDCCLSTCDKGSGDPSACLLYDDRRVCRNPDAGLVLDEEPPELIGIPADVVLECGRNFPRADVYALDNDPCYAGRVESSLSFEVPPIDNCIQRNRSRTWVAKDPSGNVSERTQLVAILADETAPQFEDPRPGDVVVDPGVDLSPENTGGSPVATDDCTSVTVSYSDEVVDESCNGMRIIRTWTATDECGNFDSYEQNITQLVLDETPPVLLDVPESFDTVCDSEFVPTPMDESGVTARDNDMCFNNEVQMSNVESGNACEGRLFTRTWSAVDPSGNTSEMTQVITVLGDQGAPEFEQPTPPDFVVPHGADMSPDNTGGSATATDDCSRDVRISYSDEIPDGFCNGERDITRTWTATDECDNSSSVEQLITQIVFDETPPTLLNVPASFDAICERDFTPTPMDDFDVTAVDDDECFNGEVQTSSVEGGNTCDGRVFTRTWSATDPSGQKVAETQTITLLRDTFKPEFTNFPNDEIFSCTAAEDDLATARTGFPGATDSCSTVGNVEYEDDSSLPDGRCFGEVVITRTFRVTDGCSNTATAPQRLTIKGDVTPPEFLRFPDDVTVTYLEDRISPEVTGWPMVTDDCSPDVMIQYEDEYSVPDDRCSGEKLITRTWTASDRCGNSATAVQKQMIRVRTVGAMFDDSLYMSTSSLKHLSMASNAFIEGGIKARKNAGINGMIGGSESSCPLPQAVVAGYKVTIQEAEAADATADARRIIHYGKSLKLKTKNGLVVNSAMSYDVEDYERLVAQTVDLSDRLFNDESLLKLDDGPRRRFCKVGLDGCGITGTVSMSTKGLVVVEDDTVKLLARHSIYNIFHLDDLEQLFTVNGKGGVRRVEFECDPTASIVLNVPGRTSTVRLQPLVYDLQACNPGQILVNIHDQERDVTVKNTPGNLYPFSLLIPKARVTLNNVVVTGQLVAKDTRLSNKAKILCPLFEGSYSCADLT